MRSASPGNESPAPAVGACSEAAAVHACLKDCGVVHADTPPAFVTARTRQKYVPFGIVFLSVARVLRVTKWSSPAPITGELKPLSAATWNS